MIVRRNSGYHRAGAPIAFPRGRSRGSSRLWRIVSSLLLLTLALGFLAWPYLPFGQQAALAPSPSAEGVAAPLPTLVASPWATPGNVQATSPTPMATTPGPLLASNSTDAPSASSASGTPTHLPPRPGVPARLRIPRIKVNAPIVGVGLLRDGELEAPQDPDQVGWFRLGPRPGEVGNALLDGHRDWISTAVFYDLDKLEKGDEVVVVDANGEERHFLVDWKELVPAEGAPLARLVGPTEVASLTLISCGGRFDRAAKEYTHRWVVRATASPDR